jgi:hypothetical protein
LIGAFFLLFGALRMGWVAAFIPTPVMRGFIEGLVLVTIIGQVPHLLGINGTSGNFFDKLWFVLEQLPDVLLASALTGLLSLAAMLLLRHLVPRVPAPLVVAVAAMFLVGLLGGEAAGVSVVGHLPSGLPHFTPPVFDPGVLRELAPGALAIVLIGYAEALGAAKAAATQGDRDIDPNQELVAHGPANILSGLFGGFLAVGSLSKTSVAMVAFAGQEGDTGRRIPDECRATLRPAIHSNLADAVEINVADAPHGRENPRTLPADIGKDVSQHRFAFLLAGGAIGGQVLVTKNEEKDRLVLTHGPARNLSPRNSVVDIDELLARTVALDREGGDVIAE